VPNARPIGAVIHDPEPEGWAEAGQRRP